MTDHTRMSNPAIAMQPGQPRQPGQLTVLRGWQAGGQPGRARGGQGGCAVALGTFDGVHRGHQAMFARLREHAARLGVPAVALTFEPMPREFLAASAAGAATQAPVRSLQTPARLTSLREKLVAFDRAGLDYCVVLRFNEALRTMRAGEFVEKLTRGLGARLVMAGHDFRFAYRGEGDTEFLRTAGEQQGFAVDVMAPVAIDGERISSTTVRAALAARDLDKASQLLGRSYAMCGRVVRGEQLGRQLGYPTANLRPRRQVVPLGGIFAVRVRGADDCRRAGVASLGTRPTVGGGEPLLEVHVFDFAGDLYGRHLEVEFVAHLREERKFDTLEALTMQMRADEKRAREALAD